MADLAENEAYAAAVYQIERNDPVDGGPDGIANLPHKHLANRTASLKAQLDAARATIVNLMESVAALEAADVAQRGRLDALEAEGGSVIRSITRGLAATIGQQNEQTITVTIPQVVMGRTKCELLSVVSDRRFYMRLASPTTIELVFEGNSAGSSISYEVIEYE